MIAPLDSEALRRQLEKTLGWSTRLALFPVRHHSPTCARHLDAFLRAYQPDCVLIEGPALYNDRIDALADPAHEAPFALVAIARAPGAGGEVLGRAYYPFCDYSPELVALRVAREIGAKARFIDLVHGERQTDLGEEPEEAAEERLGAAEDRNLARSRFTQALIERSGCRDFDEVWEALFEQAGWSETPEAWALSVAAYAHLSRAGYAVEEFEADATLDRERFMALCIAEAREQFRRVVVITGAFHTVALRETRGERLTKKAKGAPTVEVFLAPYTFPRLDALLGYASGMSGPQFYQHVWEARRRADPFAAAAQRVLVEASRVARGDGEVLGTADAIAALSFARQLAAFRGRPRVGRVELIEAAQACFVKGDASLVGQRVLGAVAEVMRGKKVGRLGPSAGQSPVVQDFHRRLRELRLPVEHGRPQPLELSIFASDLALARSRFFQQCTLLELGFCTRERGPDLATGEDLHLAIEHWSVQYVPEVETRLAELSHLGATVEDVAAALVVKACLAADGKSGELSMILLRALLLGLHRTVARLVPRLAAAMFSDDDVLSLLSAGRLLRTVLKGRERLEASLVEGLPQLARQAYVQGSLRLERLAGIGPDRLGEVLEALGSLLDVALTEPSLGPPREMLVGHARGARDAARARAPGVLGAVDGFLLQIGEIDASALAKNLASGRGRPDGVGAYLEGVLAVARQALLGDSALLEALIGHIRDSEWRDFLASLPSLRRALTRLTPRETESVAERAAAMLGVSASEMAELLEAPPEVVSRLSAWEQAIVATERTWSGSGAGGAPA